LVPERRCTTVPSQQISRSNSSKLDIPPSLLSLPILLPTLQPSSFPKTHSSLPLPTTACATISTFSMTRTPPLPALPSPVDEVPFPLKKCVPLSTNSRLSSPLLQYLPLPLKDPRLYSPLLPHRISTLVHEDLTVSKLLVKLDTPQRLHATTGSNYIDPTSHSFYYHRISTSSPKVSLINISFLSLMQYF